MPGDIRQRGPASWELQVFVILSTSDNLRIGLGYLSGRWSCRYDRNTSTGSMISQASLDDAVTAPGTPVESSSRSFATDPQLTQSRGVEQKRSTA
jgi:hypothetical protein